jgi:hypothetical protein
MSAVGLNKEHELQVQNHKSETNGVLCMAWVQVTVCAVTSQVACCDVTSLSVTYDVNQITLSCPMLSTSSTFP